MFPLIFHPSIGTWTAPPLPPLPPWKDQSLCCEHKTAYEATTAAAAEAWGGNLATAVIFGTIHAAGLRGGGAVISIHVCGYSWDGVFLSSLLIQLWGEACKMTEECASSTTAGGLNNGSVQPTTPWGGGGGMLHCEAL